MSAPGADGPAVPTGPLDPAPALDPVGPSEAGVDQRAMALPDPPTPDWSGGKQAPEWLDPIVQRMDELGETTAQLAQALQPAYSGYDDDEYGDDADLSDEEYADLEAELGDELDEIDAEALDGDEGDEGDGIERLAEALQSRFRRHEDQRDAFEDREDAFEELRESLPLLQNEQTARRIVGRARDLAMNWDPDLVERPQFVDLIRLVALAGIAEQVREREREAPDPRIVQLEAASGAVPRPDTRDQSAVIGDRIVAAARRMRPEI